MSGSVMPAASFQALHDRLRRQVPWGADDRRGALNHITPERLAAAGGEVRLGRTVTLAAPLASSAPDNPEPGARHMKRLPGEPSDVPGVSFAADQITMNVHGDVDSHIDALCHVSFDGMLYNGVSAHAVTSQGASELSIDDAVATLDTGLARGNPRRRVLVGAKGHLEITTTSHDAPPRSSGGNESGP